MKRLAQSRLKQRLTSLAMRAALAGGAAVLALCTPGCFAPFLPLALQGTEMVAKMIGIGAEAGTMVKHGDDKNPDETELYQETELDDSDFDADSAKNPANVNKCNGMVLITPAIIEFRPDHEGPPQWRELGLGGSPDAPRWTVLADASGDTGKARDIAPGGWAPATNLDHMDFKPPLRLTSSFGAPTYVAYAPDVSLAPVEHDELTSLLLDFGPVVGTFKYNGRVFRYSTLKKLPCFPVPQ